jgi:hypothetical protein
MNWSERNRKNVLSFPPPPLEPVDLDSLRALTREILEIEILERALLNEIKDLETILAESKSLKRSAYAERKTLLERLARGARALEREG